MADVMGRSVTGAPSQAQSLVGGLLGGLGQGVNQHLDRQAQLQALMAYREAMLGQKSPYYASIEARNNAMAEAERAKGNLWDEQSQTWMPMAKTKIALEQSQTDKNNRTLPSGQKPQDLAKAQKTAHDLTLSELGVDPKEVGAIANDATGTLPNGYNTLYSKHYKELTGKDIGPVYQPQQVPGWFGSTKTVYRANPALAPSDLKTSQDLRGATQPQGSSATPAAPKDPTQMDE